MRPTFSIIFFTVASGAGYGLWFLIGLGLAFYWPACGARGQPDASGLTLQLCVYPDLIPYGLALGFVLATAGLLSSLAHLGKPQRAWRAFSQWRSSWLSREGVAAMLTYVPVFGIFACGLLSWWQIQNNSPINQPDLWVDTQAAYPVFGALLALGALLTVVCTAHIYSSLKPIRAWSNRFVVAGYLLLGLYSGALLSWALTTLPQVSLRRETPALLAALVVLALICAALKYFYWRDVDRSPHIDAGHATGLDAQGTVRSFEQPHTEENYLTHEMGFVLARKHAAKLRTIALVSGFALPAMLAILSLAVPATRLAAAWCASVFGFAGIFVERWLFFAEAKHAVIAYYGR